MDTTWVVAAVPVGCAGCAGGGCRKGHPGGGAAPALRLRSGAAVRPGHSAPGGQGEQTPEAPNVPAPQPTHAAPCTERWGGHTSGAQSACARGGKGDAGCVPAAQVKAPTRHIVAEVAPATIVEEPAGQAAQAPAPAARATADQVPSGQLSQDVDPEEAAKVPGGQSRQSGAPTVDT